MTEKQEPITVQFTITPETVIGTHYRQISEDDYATEPETLADRVASLVAEKVYREAKGSWYSRSDIDDAVDKIIAARVVDVLDKQVTPTDAYGNAKGEPTTLAEMIDKRVDTWLKAAHKQDSYGRPQTTNLQAIIDAAVSRAITADVNEAIKAAKAEATRQVQAAASAVFSETIARAAGVR
jgi:hypothetical protein